MIVDLHNTKRIKSKRINEVVISELFQKNPPRTKKILDKLYRFVGKKKLDPIIVNENMVLVD